MLETEMGGKRTTLSGRATEMFVSRHGKLAVSCGRFLTRGSEKWGELTDDDLTVISGKKAQLVGKIQERFGIAKDAAEKQVDEYARSYGSGESARAKAKSSCGAAQPSEGGMRWQDTERLPVRA
jgi:uncharacterized protein YjbJ (UPF0337 family)